MLFHRPLDPLLGPDLMKWQILKYVLLVEHDALRARANQVLVVTILPALVALVVTAIKLK